MSRSTGTDGFLGDSGGRRTGWVLAAIVAVAAGLRGYQLGRLSFWYDEVVTMRLARAGSPAALIELLFRIDATRAPLHPLLLEGWVGIFGVSEASARAFSVLCSVATVWLIFDIGRLAFDTRTGLWSAWLAALSPVLVVYSREARMYAWFVLVTCLCWRVLLGLRGCTRRLGIGWVDAAIHRGEAHRDGQGRSGEPPDADGVARPTLRRLLVLCTTPVKALTYSIGLAALVYSHPLGLLMAATLALAGLVGLRACYGSWKRWLAVHVAAALMVAPWVVHYFDHPPEFVSGPLSLRFLLGTPIGFIGGNFAVLAGLVPLIAWGVVCLREGESPSEPRRRDLIVGRWLAPAFLLLWLIVPPTALYVYSRLFQPIFGPQRYTVHSAPAYLVLVALGLTRSPAVLRYPLAVVLSILAASELGPKVYGEGLKADWRGFATALAAQSEGPIVVIVSSSNQGRNVEVETARYYLPAGCEAIPLDEATPELLESARAAAVYLAVGSRRGSPAVAPPGRIGPYSFRPDRSYPGLMILRAEHGSADPSTPHSPPKRLMILRAEHGTTRGGLGLRGGGSSSGPRRRPPGDTAGLVGFGAGLEDRQHQGFEVLVEL
jgi:hypothetical protein